MLALTSILRWFLPTVCVMSVCLVAVAEAAASDTPDASVADAERARIHEFLAFRRDALALRQAVAAGRRDDSVRALAQRLAQGLPDRVSRRELSAGEALHMQAGLLQILQPDPARRPADLAAWRASLAATVAAAPAAQAAGRPAGRDAHRPAAAPAAWFIWQTVELSPATGASCGDGSPYRFFVNRTPLNNHVVISFEGGGACWDQDACEGRGEYSATNPDGIPADYLSQPNAAAGGLVTPFTARLDPFQSVQTQDWTLVYLPYCTGDVHTGQQVRLYDDSRPDRPRLQYHSGQANVRAAADWLRRHVGRPDKLLLTGFSAGGVGATAQYPIVRDRLAPSGRATLLADSGPLMPAPRGASRQQSPSLPLHEKIRATWGLDSPGGLIPTLQDLLPTLDVNDLGSLSGALARRYAKDRFGYMTFQEDAIFAGFSYLDFHPEIAAEPDPRQRAKMLNDLWRQDLATWLPRLAAEPNVQHHVPFFRDFNGSHCLTLVDFSGTGIQEVGIGSVEPFINNALERKPPMRTVEQDQVSDLSQPLSPALEILAIVLELFG